MGRRTLWRVSAGGAALVCAALLATAVLLERSGHAQPGPTLSASTRTAATGAAVPPPAADPSLTLSVAPTSPGPTVAPGFLGFSFEFQAVRAYTGSDPRAINPVLVQLIRNLTPGQAPVLRIGGDSTDISYAPAAGVRPPAWVTYRLGAGWMATTAALAHRLGARMIMGLNLAADQPRLSAAESRAFLKAFGTGTIEALEIGNEPNVYQKNTVYHTLFGVPVSVRPSSFDYRSFRRQFTATASAAAPAASASGDSTGGTSAGGDPSSGTPAGVALAGPALAIGPTPSAGSWVRQMPSFLTAQSRMSIMTVHRYPLRNCYVPPSSPQYPSVAHLLSDYATSELASSLKRWVRIAHGKHRQLRVDELNSVACRGKTGVSDTFASALWVTDALFSLARVGVNGVNMHTLPDTAYQLFSFSHTAGGWQGAVAPVYYGLQLFAQAAPAGSRIVAVHRRGHAAGLSTWATRAPDGTIRTALINKSAQHDQTIRLRVPGATGATVERLLAPSVSASRGITLGGRTYGARTATGALGSPRTSHLTGSHDSFTLSVPHGSAALVTFAGG